jgi:hypothetical protein
VFKPRIVPIVNFAFDLHHSGAGKGHPRLQRLNLLNEMLQSAPGVCDLSPKGDHLLVVGHPTIVALKRRLMSRKKT